jgi:hypothetical protein
MHETSSPLAKRKGQTERRQAVSLNQLILWEVAEKVSLCCPEFRWNSSRDLTVSRGSVKAAFNPPWLNQSQRKLHEEIKS